MFKMLVHHFENLEKSKDDSLTLRIMYKYRDSSARAVMLNFWEVHEIKQALQYGGFDKALTDLFDELWHDMRKEVNFHEKK